MKKTNQLLICLLIFLTFYQAAMSQSSGTPFTVSGKVADEKEQPAPYATVTILKASDSSLIKGAITDETGKYVFSPVATGKYIISATGVGMIKSYSLPFTIDAGHPTEKVPVLTLKQNTNMLKGVSVTATKPFIEHKLDKTVVNVENSIVSAGNTALEVLEKAPGVMVDNNGNISLKGKNGVVIMIDGKRTYLSQEQVTNMLKSMSASQLSQIEIMTNPSAKYDAAGNAGIINIKLKKNANEGMNGSVNLGYSQGVYAHYDGGLNLNYKKGKINTFANYDASKGNWWTVLGLTRKFYPENSKAFNTLMEQNSFMKFPSTNQSFKAGVDYSIDKKNTIGVMVNGTFSNGESLNNGPISFYNGDHQLDSTAVPDSHSDKKWNSVTYNLNYKLTIDTAGQELTASFDYSGFDNSSQQDYETMYYDEVGNVKREPKIRRGYLPSDIDIKSGKVDYVLPLNSKAKMEAGLKSSFVTSDNNVQYENFESGKWHNDIGATNHFIYKENINAAYLNFNKEFKKGWAVQLGLRGEQTVSKADQLTIDSVVNRNYFQLFPSVFVKKDLNKNNTLTFSYSRRIDRPDYGDLNPFRYYIDDYTYNEGNSFLQPQLTNSFELSHSFKGMINTTLNYSHTTDVMTDVLRQNDSTRVGFQTKDNLNTLDNIGLSVSVPVTITKWWMSNNFVNVFYNLYKGQLNGGDLNKGITSYMINTTNTFTLPWDMKAELSGFYRSGFVFGPLIGKPMYRISVGLQKSFWNKRANLKLNINDLFKTQKFEGYMKYQNIDMNIQNHWESRRAGLTFTYNFGNQNLKPAHQKHTGIEEEQNRIKKSNSGGN